MSTVQRVNFEPLSNIAAVDRRDYPLANTALANPNDPYYLVDGEWMKFDNSGKLVRATDVTVLGDPATTISFALWAERGRYDVQATSAKKMPIMFLHEYEAQTRIYDASAVVGSGAAITAVNQPLKVATIALGGRNYTGLVGATMSDNAAIVGYVTGLPASNGGWLKFVQKGAVRNGST